MVEPVRKPGLDATLRLYGNGKLPRTLLKKIHAGGELYGPAAWWANVMFEAAKNDGITLRSVSAGYRSYERQKELFLERYSKLPTLRRPKVTRVWEGRTWWLKKGKSPSASPGKSDHGWGLAQDFDVRDRAVYRWLCANGPKYGFYMESPSTSPNFEAWHWAYCGLK
jgi:LAS superfamily LD-carboxypeptidase LdcB